MTVTSTVGSRWRTFRTVAQCTSILCLSTPQHSDMHTFQSHFQFTWCRFWSLIMHYECDFESSCQQCVLSGSHLVLWAGINRTAFAAIVFIIFRRRKKKRKILRFFPISVFDLPHARIFYTGNLLLPTCLALAVNDENSPFNSQVDKCVNQAHFKIKCFPHTHTTNQMHSWAVPCLRRPQRKPYIDVEMKWGGRRIYVRTMSRVRLSCLHCAMCVCACVCRVQTHWLHTSCVIECWVCVEVNQGFVSDNSRLRCTMHRTLTAHSLGFGFGARTATHVDECYFCFLLCF